MKFWLCFEKISDPDKEEYMEFINWFTRWKSLTENSDVINVQANLEKILEEFKRYFSTKLLHLYLLATAEMYTPKPCSSFTHKQLPW